MSDLVLHTLKNEVEQIDERLRLLESLPSSGSDDEQFRMMADSAPVLLWVAGPDGLCTFFNRPWLHFTGRPLADELGSGWAEGIHAEDFHATMTSYVEAFVDRRPFQLEYRLRRADGEYRWLLDTGVPRYLPSGEFAGYIGSCIDVADKKHAEDTLRQSEARLRCILDAAADGIVTFGADGLLESINPAAERLFGWNESEILGRPAGALVPELAEWERFYVNPSSGRVARETVGRHKSGALLPIEVTLSAAGEPRVTIAVVRDVAERRSVDRRVLEESEALKARIGQDLHDGLGQHLTGIALMAQGLAEELPSSLRPRGARLLDLLNDAIGQVKNLARGLSPVRLESLDDALRELASRCSSTLGISCSVDGAKVETTAAVTFQLYMIAQEAISNAVRHGSAKNVSLGASSDGDHHVLWIEDDGVGLSADPSMRGPRTGTGMGLINMKFRARLIGGVLEIEPGRPHGTVVRCAWWSENVG